MPASCPLSFHVLVTHRKALANGTSEDMAIAFINNSRAAQRQKYNHQYN
jgi:hypothetical protein